MENEYIAEEPRQGGLENTLAYLNRSLQAVSANVELVNSTVDRVSNNLMIAQSEIAALAQEFHAFVDLQKKANAKADSQTRLIQIRQELEKRFGHYDAVRRTAAGILQADDLGLVKKATVSDVTEELMLSTPGYWLAPCLVALAAWINDQPELAEKAVREAIRRNDEKTSLFWALICRRAGRKSASLKWTQRYLANQDEEHLDRTAIIVLDAFAGGLLGSDSEGVISRQLTAWLDRLADKPGFVEQQTQQWSDAIRIKRKPYDGSEYTYLRRYSRTWPALQEIMEGASLHAEMLAYFAAVFGQEATNESLKGQLDDILDSLVSGFDEEERSLRQEETYHQLVANFGGDEDLARQHMAIEQTAFEDQKDFTRLLTDAAMRPQTSHASVSTQKFAVALSKEWIGNAYNDLVAENRMKIPHEIEINIDTFNDKTTDGRDEAILVDRFNALIDKEKNHVLSPMVLSGFETFCLWGGFAVGLIGLFLVIVSFFFAAYIGVALGAVIIIAGVGMVVNHVSRKNRLLLQRQHLSDQFEEKREKGLQILRATLAEVVDFRAEFAARDGESRQVVAFLEQISPEQYVRKLSDTGRRIYVGN